MARLENLTRPAPTKMMAVCLNRALKVFGLPDGWDEIADAYEEALAVLPEDLLLEATKHVRTRCRFFPKPGDFMAPVAEELERRVDARDRVRAIIEWDDRQIAEAKAQRERERR